MNHKNKQHRELQNWFNLLETDPVKAIDQVVYYDFHGHNMEITYDRLRKLKNKFKLAFEYNPQRFEVACISWLESKIGQVEYKDNKLAFVTFIHHFLISLIDNDNLVVFYQYVYDNRFRIQPWLHSINIIGVNGCDVFVIPEAAFQAIVDHVYYNQHRNKL